MKRISIILGLLLVLLATSCASDAPGDVPGTEAPLTGISLQLGPGGVATTRAFGGDANAREHEFIHSLTVVVANEQGLAELVLTPTATELGSEAEQGNLIEKTFANLTLVQGRKTIYAFANLEGYTTTDGKRLTDLLEQVAVGQPLPTALLTAVVADPAAQINANGDNWTHFIPMTAAQQVTLTTNGQTVRVEMVRLVSRIELSITNKRTDEAVKLTELTIGRFASAVTLFAQDKAGNLRRLDNGYTISPELEAQPNGGQAGPVSFYANATEDALGEKFSIRATLEGIATTYRGNTARTDLPRNSILPLQLIFSDYEMKLNVKAQIAPIGGYPIEVYSANALTNELLVKLPEGCSFTITPHLYEGTLEDLAARSTWTPGADLTWLSSVQQTDKYFQAIAPARAGLQGTLTIHSVSGRGRQGDYILTLQTEDLAGFTKPATSPGRWQAAHAMGCAIFMTTEP